MILGSDSISTDRENQGASLLVVSPNGRLRQELRERLVYPRWALTESGSGAEAFEYLEDGAAAVLLLDPLLPDLESSEFSTLVAERFPAVQIITLNTHTGRLVLGSTSPTPLSAEIAEALQGEHETPVSPSRSDAMLYPHSESRRPMGLPGVIGESRPMLRVAEMTRLVAARDTTVLVTGESGTGKDLIAQAVHLLSPRDKKPLVVINCAAMHGGTLFLDEIGDMPLSLQSKILRFLEQGEVQRIGGTDNLRVDVRVVAATNASLKTLVAQKLFREDLYYRLAIFPIQLPQLRERHGDVTLLAQNFVSKFCPHAKLSTAALDILEKHDWPGNVRELHNVLERASILATDERQILPHHILL